MRTALDTDPLTLNGHETNFVAGIRKHGWLQTSVREVDEGPGVSYTTGFWLRFNLPGLITFSLEDETTNDGKPPHRWQRRGCLRWSIVAVALTPARSHAAAA
jgi:hypothetical protein